MRSSKDARKEQRRREIASSTGRTVEEVVMRRKLEEMAIKGSTSMPNLAINKRPGSFLPAIGTNNYTSALSSPNTYSAAEEHKVYSEGDVRNMMEEVMKYCRALQHRVQDLEVQVIQANTHSHLQQATTNNQDLLTSTASTAHTTAIGAVKRVSIALPPTTADIPTVSTSNFQTIKKSSLSTENAMNQFVGNIDNKVAALRAVFRAVDPLQERQFMACKIQALIRGFLARCRYQHHRTGVKEFRWIRCRPVIWLLDILLANQSKLDSGFQLLRMNRVMRTLFSVYHKWSAVTHKNAPLRRHIKKKAEEKIYAKRIGFLNIHFQALKSVTVGKISRKAANQTRKKMIEQIRSTISLQYIQQGSLGIVPEYEIITALHKQVVEEFQLRKKTLILGYKFSTFKSLLYHARLNHIKSLNHHFKSLVGRVFYAWSEYTYLKSRGLDRKRWPAPRKYEVRYNQKRVDYFSQIRCLRLVFGAWSVYQKRMHVVRVKYQQKVAGLMIQVFQGWRKVAQSQHHTRSHVITNWQGYSTWILSPVFSAWADYVQGQKNKYQEHLRIARAYMRWKLRQRLVTILKVWRHQALFGRIDGLYTRQMLLKTLGEQKVFSTSIEKLLADQTMELEETRLLTYSEIDKRKTLETEITALNHDKTKLKMNLHHHEQELRRLTALLDALRVINPKQLEHLEALQGSNFVFTERKIAIALGAEEEEALLASTSTAAPTTTAAAATSTSQAATSTAESNKKRRPVMNDEEAEEAEADDGSVSAAPAAAAAVAAQPHDMNAGNFSYDPTVMMISGTASDDNPPPPPQQAEETEGFMSISSSNRLGSLGSIGGSRSITHTPLDIINEDKVDTARSNNNDNEGDEMSVLSTASANISATAQQEAAVQPTVAHLSTTRVMSTVVTKEMSTQTDESLPSPTTYHQAAAPSITIHSAISYDNNDAKSMASIKSTAYSEPGLVTIDQDQARLLERLKWVMERYQAAGSDDAALPATTTNTATNNKPRGSVMAADQSNNKGGNVSKRGSLLRASNPFVRSNLSTSFSAVQSPMTMAMALQSSPANNNNNGLLQSPVNNSSKSRPSFTFAEITGNNPNNSETVGKSETASTSESPSRGGDRSPSKSRGNTPSKSFRKSAALRSGSIGGGGGGGGTAGGQMAPGGGLSSPLPGGIKPLRSSYSRSPSFFGTNQLQLQLQIQQQQQELQEMYYHDEELEDIVITWAKMLFTILEFLETGDITNLPEEDKRLWAKHLLATSQPAKPVVSSFFSDEVIADEGGGADESGRQSTGSANDIETAIRDALITVDERMHGRISWREALLQLRTMFPGAGNFSGFGVGIELEHDTHLFQRLLKMRSDLQKVEDLQVNRYQRNFMSAQNLGYTTQNLGLLETLNRTEEKMLYKPLGTDVYASNLNKLRDVDNELFEQESRANSPDINHVLKSPHHLELGGDL